MEAVGAIFLLAILAAIMGNYWSHLAQIRSVTQQKMEAVALAAQLFDQCAAGRRAWTTLEGKHGRYRVTCAAKSIPITTVSYTPDTTPVLVTLTFTWKVQDQEYQAEYRAVCSQEAV